MNELRPEDFTYWENKKPVGVPDLIPMSRRVRKLIIKTNPRKGRR